MQNTFYALPFTPSPLQVSAFLISASQAFTQCVCGGQISHQEFHAIHIDHGELTSHKELRCSIAGRPMLLSAYFILIDQDSPEFY